MPPIPPSEPGDWGCRKVAVCGQQFIREVCPTIPGEFRYPNGRAKDHRDNTGPRGGWGAKKAEAHRDE